MKKQDLPYWELNPETKQLVKAKVYPGAIFCSWSAEYGSETIETSYVKKEDGMIYFQALNERNAIRKAKRMTG